jgi:predicted transcriptional regulator
MNGESLYGFEFRDVDRRRSDRSGTWDIKQLWQRSHEILGLALGGMSQVDIAKHLDITPATVSNTMNSTLGQEKLSEMRKTRDERYEKINEEVLSLTEKAMGVYDEIFGSGTASLDLKKKAADTVALDIAGMRAPTKIDTRTQSESTRKEIHEFRVRGLAAAKDSGFLVEVPGEGESEERKAIDVTP